MNFLDFLLLVTIVLCACLLLMSFIYICIYSVNLCYKQNSSSLIYTIFEDQNIMRALKARFFQYLPGNRILFNASEAQDEHLSACIGSAELIGRGWEKEALPVIQTKKSTISRIFSTFFD